MPRIKRINKYHAHIYSTTVPLNNYHVTITAYIIEYATIKASTVLQFISCLHCLPLYSAVNFFSRHKLGLGKWKRSTRVTKIKKKNFRVLDSFNTKYPHESHTWLETEYQVLCNIAFQSMWFLWEYLMVNYQRLRFLVFFKPGTLIATSGLPLVTTYYCI